jgi:ATPase subunit of ABC transporter with duplicated ATPase domains
VAVVGKDQRRAARRDFGVAPGSVFALLGANGAGKTTVVRILSTPLKSDAGTATVDGFDVAAHPSDVRESISLTGQFATKRTRGYERDEPRSTGTNCLALFFAGSYRWAHRDEGVFRKS